MTFDELERLHSRAFPDLRGWSADEFRALIDDPSTIFIALPQAFILGRVAVDEAEVLTISTDPDHRRKGKAARLLARFEEVALGRGAGLIFLEVASDNLAALQLYDIHGFAEVGRRPGYYMSQIGTASDALILRKQLAAG